MCRLYWKLGESSLIVVYLSRIWKRAEKTQNFKTAGKNPYNLKNGGKNSWISKPCG